MRLCKYTDIDTSILVISMLDNFYIPYWLSSILITIYIDLYINFFIPSWSLFNVICSRDRSDNYSALSNYRLIDLFLICAKSLSIIYLVIVFRSKIRLKSESIDYQISFKISSLHARNSISNWLRRKYSYIFQTFNILRISSLFTDTFLYTSDNSKIYKLSFYNS